MCDIKIIRDFKLIKNPINSILVLRGEVQDISVCVVTI
jgi:hypothetical protein